MKKFLSLFLILALMPLMSTCAFVEKKPHKDYLPVMINAAADGNVDLGRLAESCRNELIDNGELHEVKISFDELYLLSRFICAEAGKDWLTDEYRFCTGEVALNRLASPEFPDSLGEVIFQSGQYSNIDPESFSQLTKPSRECVEVAVRLLQGERMLAPQVVYQSKSRISNVYATFSDYILGHTYFCETMFPDLYQ